MFNWKQKLNRQQAVLTADQYRKLVEQHAASLSNGGASDFKPVVKFFNPVGAATWIFSEMDPETGIAYGLADLGLGCVEYGSTDLNELIALKGKLRFGLGIERDYHFKGEHPLSWYKQKADENGDRLIA